MQAVGYIPIVSSRCRSSGPIVNRSDCRSSVICCGFVVPVNGSMPICIANRKTNLRQIPSHNRWRDGPNLRLGEDLSIGSQQRKALINDSMGSTDLPHFLDPIPIAA